MFINFLFRILFIFILIVLYFHVYHCFKINKENDIQFMEENSITKRSLDREILYKLPLYMTLNTIDYIDEDKIAKLTKLESNSKQKHDSYENQSAYDILEPNIIHERISKVFFTNKNKKSNLKIHENLSFRNFYIVHKGNVNVTIIHPMYKYMFLKDNEIQCNKDVIKSIKNNDNFIHLELHEKSILYVPNYWLVHVELSKSTILEKVQYIPFVNKLNIFYKNIISKKISHDEN